MVVRAAVHEAVSRRRASKGNEGSAVRGPLTRVKFSIKALVLLVEPTHDVSRACGDGARGRLYDFEGDGRAAGWVGPPSLNG